MRAIDADKLLRDIEKYHVSDGKFQHWVQIQRTIEPERKRGKWFQVHVDGFTPGGNCLSICSECGWKFETHMIYPDYNFCPNCGADMREDAEEPKKCDTCKHEKEPWSMHCHSCDGFKLWEAKR